VLRKTDINEKLVRFAWWALATIVFTVVVAIRIRLLGIPLERDEGEYAYAGQLMLQGIPPYKLAYNMKFPGTYAAYALLMSIFGQTILGIHVGFLLVNAATTALIFLLGRRLINEMAGLVAAGTYAVLSLSPTVLGFAAHATHFVMLPVLSGMLLLLLDQPTRAPFGRLFASGLLFGLAGVMKQPGIFFVLFAVIYLIRGEIRSAPGRKEWFARILVFGGGVILPFGIMCLLLFCAAVFREFWFWTVDYAQQYGTLVRLGDVPLFLLGRTSEVIGANWPLWTLAAGGAVAGVWNKRLRAGTLFCLVFLFFSALAVCPGLYFRHHYFIFVLPAVALLAGTGISALSTALPSRATASKLVSLVVIAAALALPIMRYRKLFFEVSPVQVSRMVYGESPFQESVRIADYLREHTDPDEKIAVLGSEPEIYFYSRRHSATGYIYTYPLMEPQKYARRMQEEMIREIERWNPTYLVSVVMNDSWLQRPGSDPLIFTWASEYIAKNYVPAGFVNIKPMESDYFFGDVPQSVETLRDYILIYRRNP
jgi:4-amino-4-deoxy-L-arabinose transferase-like glycosyltransferase